MRTQSRAPGAVVCAILFTALAIAGCSGRSTASSAMPAPSPMPSGSPTPMPAPSPSPTPSVPTAASRFIYAIGDFEADGGFFGGSINGSTGQVTPLAGNPFPNTLGQNIVIQVISDPLGRFLYSLNIGASSFGIQFGKPGINEYQVNQTNGALQPVPNGPFIFTSGGHQGLIAIDGKGKFLYELNGSAIDIYSIDQTSGLLTLLGSSSAAAPVGNPVAASPDGRFLFNSGAGTVEVFSIDQTNGQLSLASTEPSAGSGDALAVSSDSTLLFVANATQGSLAVFNIETNGRLTPVPGSPFTIDAQAETISVSPNNKFVYMAFGQPSQEHVKGYQFDAMAGTLAAIPSASIANANSINVDHSGKFAFASFSQQVNTYTIDPTSGALMQTSQAPQPLTDNPADITVTP